MLITAIHTAFHAKTSTAVYTASHPKGTPLGVPLPRQVVCTVACATVVRNPCFLRMSSKLDLVKSNLSPVTLAFIEPEALTSRGDWLLSELEASLSPLFSMSAFHKSSRSTRLALALQPSFSRTRSPSLLGKTLCCDKLTSIAKQVLKDGDAIFANRDPTVAAIASTYGGDIVWSPNDPEWRKLRKILIQEMMSKTSLYACHTFHRQEVRKMVKEVYAKAGNSVPINIREQMFLTILDVINAHDMGWFIE
ncbi:hypothetical protein QYF36_012999 [Acer negundo]|nr:hypothetical protein QYF36_012999 [Acer negundo]